MLPFKTTWRPTGGYWPTAPVTGDSADFIYRGQNLIVKGRQPNVYCEQWNGYQSIDAAGNNVTLTGTVATTAGSKTFSGTSTKFLSELIIGQMILVNGRVYGVEKIVSNTSMDASVAANATASGLSVTYLKQIQELDFFRASFIRGSILRLAQGNLLGVGAGEVRLDGSTLTSSMTLMNQAQLAVLDVPSGNFSVYRLGLQTPVITAVARTTGGSKNMQPGVYGIRIVAARSATGGFNQPSESAPVTLTNAGDRIQITFPAMDSGNGQDSWRIYGTLYSTSEGLTGPWYYVTTLTSAAVAAAGGTAIIEYQDGEIQNNDLLEFDNDPPPPAAFIGSLGGLPVLIGTNGPGRALTGTVAITNGSRTVTGTGTTFGTELTLNRLVWINNLLYRVTAIATNTSLTIDPPANTTTSGLTMYSADECPGPVLRPAKIGLGGYNIEAFPAKAAVAVNPPETILGYVEGVGRLFPMTRNRLHVAVLSGDPEVPVTTRPFWKAGFRNARACCFVNEYLYGFTTAGATRSSAQGDSVEEEHAFAAPVAADMALWDPAKTIVVHDPVLQAVCFIHCDDGTRLGGTKRYSTMLKYMLQSGTWSAPCRIEDTADSSDRWVGSAATINGKLYYAAMNSSSTSIYEDNVGGNNGEVWAAPPFMDAGAEGMDKAVEGLVITAAGSNPIVCNIYGSKADGDVPIADLVAGTNSQSGPINFSNNGTIRTSRRKKMHVKDLRLMTARVSLAASGLAGARIDEGIMDGQITQVRY